MPERILLFIACIFLPVLVNAGIYKWIDEDGKTHYSDSAPDGGSREFKPEPEPSAEAMRRAREEMKSLLEKCTTNRNDLLERVEIEIKYTGYIDREKIIADKIKRLEDIEIHKSIDYDKLTSISYEGRQKLKRTRPHTIGQASRISGVSPADINVLLVHIGR